MNENNNRVNAAIPATDLAAILTTIGTLASRLSSVTIGLTEDERKTLPRINVANRAFVQDALNLMGTDDGASFIPAYLQPAAAQVDLELFEQMDQIFAALQPIFQRVIDTRTLSGSEGYSTSLTFYKLAQSAAEAGIPGAQAIVDALKARFTGQGGSGGGNGE